MMCDGLGLSVTVPTTLLTPSKWNPVELRPFNQIGSRAAEPLDNYEKAPKFIRTTSAPLASIVILFTSAVYRNALTWEVLQCAMPRLSFYASLS